MLSNNKKKHASIHHTNKKTQHQILKIEKFSHQTLSSIFFTDLEACTTL